MTKLQECPRCGGWGRKSNWLPPPGMDARMRNYICPRCHFVWYALTGRRDKADVKLQVNKSGAACIR